MLRNPKNSLSGTTLIETLVAATIVAGFFVSIFELNGVCLRYIKSSKNNAAALQGVQDRLDQLRDLSFASLATAATVQTLMAAPANASQFLARSPKEVVTLTGYQTMANFFAGTADATPTKIQLLAGGSSATIISTDANLSTAALAKINVTYTWTEAFGGRTRSEQSETIISPGAKK